MLSDRYRDPQSYVLAYDNAYKVGQAIVKDGDNIYLRAKNAAVECCNIVEEGAAGKLELSRFEAKALADAKAALEALPDDMGENLTGRKDHSIIVAALIFMLLAAIFAVIVFKQINPGKFTLPFYFLVMGMFFFATAMESESKLGERLASLSWTLNMDLGS